MIKKEFIIEVNSADDGDILIWKPPKDLFPPIPVKKELVRCKDCKWWTQVNNSLQGRCAVFLMYQTREWYCANAERRES